jgi:hypothetical protein
VIPILTFLVSCQGKEENKMVEIVRDSSDGIWALIRC